MSIWKEIRNHHYDEGEEKIFIDAYLTNNASEEGRVIAKVDMSCIVEYINERARTDAYAQEIISDTQFDILAKQTYELYKKDWCDSRGYNLQDYDEELGFNGESFACFDEYRETEFQDSEYMKYLLGEKYLVWLLISLKEIQHK